MSESGITSQKLNLTLALCAILISVASFYATYLQANAAEKQVKAMTLPLLQYGTSNLDKDTNEPLIQFSIENAGVGPALVKNLTLTYQDKRYKSIENFLEDCCAKEFEKFQEKASLDLSKGGYITSTVVNKILPAQQEIIFYQLHDGEVSNALWNKLNIARSKLQVSICYCSLLDECYVTEKNGVVDSVAECPVN